MENNNQYDELLVRYLVDEVTDDEKLFVESWSNTSEANKRYFDELKKAWELASARKTLDFLLDELDVDEKWNRFQANVRAKSGLTSSNTVKEEPEVQDE